VLDHEHVQLVPVLARDEGLEEFAHLFRGRRLIHKPQPDRDAMDVRVHGEHRHAEGKQQRAVSGLGTNPREAPQVFVSRLFPHRAEELEIDSSPVGPNPPKDRLDPRGLESTEAAHANVALDFVDRRVRHLVPRSEPPAKLPITGGAVGRTGVLRQDCVHQHADAASPYPRCARPVRPPQQSQNALKSPFVTPGHARILERSD
jgi:hypothetical protein